MPDQTPKYGIPFALGTDPRRDYPAVVDAPAAQAAEDELARLDANLGNGDNYAIRSGSTLLSPDGAGENHASTP